MISEKKVKWFVLCTGILSLISLNVSFILLQNSNSSPVFYLVISNIFLLQALAVGVGAITHWNSHRLEEIKEAVIDDE